MYRAPLEERRQISHFFVAIDLDHLVGRDAFARRLQAIVDDIRKQPHAGQPVMVPGDPEKKTWGRRVREGIPMDEEKFAEYCTISTDFAEAVRR